MKKILLASLVATASIFAAETATPAPVKADTTKTIALAKDTTKTAPAPVKADSLKTVATAKDTTKVAPAPIKADSAKTLAPAKDTTKAAAAPVKADSLKTAAAVKETTKAAPVKSNDEIVLKDYVKPAPVENDNSMAAPSAKQKTKEEKKPLFAVGQFAFDVNASFEIQAGKVLWMSEDDENGYNLEEWWGRANLALITRSNDFDGKMLIWMYPGDLQDNQYHTHHVAGGDTTDTYEYRDLFEIHEAWAEQRTKYVAFKLGRWEFTQKNGDYFGNYVDGYYNGFKSGTASANALQFTISPTPTMTMDAAFISTEPNLNKGDLRLMFHFHDLSGIEALNLDLGYRTNIFDEVYDSDSDVRHTIALQGKVPLVKNLASFFLEGALMGIDAEETYVNSQGREKTRSVDMVAPLTGGLVFTPKDYRIILEAEYMHNREDTEYAEDSKHIKDILGAFYIEKPLSKRFTLSFGAHSYGNSRDVEFNGNLIGTIN
ncbi:MAG: hypothetical protein M0P13_03130 [Fibrobacteraceae bacterium]|nr:hypothetical protein [Fibrobacteraceae bacterium]